MSHHILHCRRITLVRYSKRDQRGFDDVHTESTLVFVPAEPSYSVSSIFVKFIQASKFLVVKGVKLAKSV